MTLASIFEDFSGGDRSTGAPAPARAQGDPLEGYETGYQAGWDDALKAQVDSKTHLASALASNLEQIEFTMLEAQTQVLTGLRPVLGAIVSTLLPNLSSSALESLVKDEIEPLLKEHVPSDIALAVAVEDEQAVAAFLNETRALSEITLTSKDTIGEGQAYVTCPTGQRKVDVAAAIADIQERLDSFLQQPELERVNAN